VQATTKLDKRKSSGIDSRLIKQAGGEK